MTDIAAHTSATVGIKNLLHEHTLVEMFSSSDGIQGHEVFNVFSFTFTVGNRKQYDIVYDVSSRTQHNGNVSSTDVHVRESVQKQTAGDKAVCLSVLHCQVRSYHSHHLTRDARRGYEMSSKARSSLIDLKA